MDLSGIIADLHKNTEEQNMSFDISQDDIDDSVSILKHHRVNNIKDVFLFLSAINLLNAAIKRPEYKKKLGYGFVKGKALILAKIIITRYKYNDVLYYYNVEEKCLYISVYGVVFSFHNVREEVYITKHASCQKKIIWPGIRLQKIAQPLLSLAKEIYHKHKSEY